MPKARETQCIRVSPLMILDTLWLLPAFYLFFKIFTQASAAFNLSVRFSPMASAAICLCSAKTYLHDHKIFTPSIGFHLPVYNISTHKHQLPSTFFFIEISATICLQEFYLSFVTLKFTYTRGT